MKMENKCVFVSHANAIINADNACNCFNYEVIEEAWIASN